MKRFTAGSLEVIAGWPYEIIERDGDSMVIEDIADGSQMQVTVHLDGEGEYVTDTDGGRYYPHS